MVDFAPLLNIISIAFRTRLLLRHYADPLSHLWNRYLFSEAHLLFPVLSLPLIPRSVRFVSFTAYVGVWFIDNNKDKFVNYRMTTSSISIVTE